MAPSALQLPPGHRPIGKWLPSQRAVIQKWVASRLSEAKHMKDLPLHPSLVALQQLVNSNKTWQDLSNDMFTQSSKYYQDDPTGHAGVKNFGQFLNVVNVIIQSPPPFYNTETPPTAMGLIGFPINAVLDWPMGTIAGYEFWLIPAINAAFKDVLNTWGQFLESQASQAGLKDWLSPDALLMLAEVANTGRPGPPFDQLFECDSAAPFYGYKSWDDFFTRKFRDGVRPIEYADDGPQLVDGSDPSLVITNACESAPLQVVENVKLHDQFWLKSQPYSLDRMLNSNPKTSQFVDGTVYQAFLSAKSYHRWHAPVSGTVVEIDMVPGSYYSENYFEGLAGNPEDPDPAAPNYSQPYISAVATRAIIWIQANNPTIGLMAIVFIGMAEVSGCEFTVAAKDTIVKGQDIGMFHFGGSSHCMIFRPGVKLVFANPPPWDMDHEHNNRVNSTLALVSTQN
ncbi:phosphatidylserine decarboxylase [Fusarium heterosporum]|uniref:Phosphatidylserine decarboxylase n=1 Tax=Fusarium heterosporum TaxID=42747 RepID=A0A8H5T409_FUSHE|nr:phosphatidylserine decarboxylase [Fusarium heterosporum]